MANTKLHRGTLLAELLAGSWRQDVRPCSLSVDELDLILPLVFKSGTAGLAWRRVRRTALAETEAGEKLHAVRIGMAAEAAIRDSQLRDLLSVDRFGKADPIVVKGWAHARLFPEPGLRPYGDFDLFVRPDRYEEVRTAYRTYALPHPEHVIPVDFQSDWLDLPDRSWDEVQGRSALVSLGGLKARVLGPEDAFRLACLHLLRHYACNPLWLCDIAVMMENHSADFDWEYCLYGQPRRTQWMLAVIRLANRVLGASTERCPAGRLPGSVPWMEQTVLSIWGDGHRFGHPWPLPRPIGKVVRRDIRKLPHALAERWPNPIESVLRVAWPINRISGRAAQVVDYTMRTLSWGPRRVRPNAPKVIQAQGEGELAQADATRDRKVAT